MASSTNYRPRNKLEEGMAWRGQAGPRVSFYIYAYNSSDSSIGSVKTTTTEKATNEKYRRSRVEATTEAWETSEGEGMDKVDT